MRTHIVSILDRSGSMESRVGDVIGGYNSFLEEQRSVGLAEDTWSLTIFDHDIAKRLDRVPLGRVPRLTNETFRARGSTALYDAIGLTLSPWAHGLNENERGILVIATDGEENASKIWKLDQIKHMLEELERSGAWTIVYLGVEVSGFGKDQHSLQASASGFAQTNTLTHASVNQLYGATSGRIAALRQSSTRATRDLYTDALPPADEDEGVSFPRA